VNYAWLKCSDDTAAAVFAPANNPSTDYAWIRISGVFLKCYYDHMTSVAATSPVPCVVESTGAAPTECDDVTVENFSDTFSDASINCMWVGSGDAGGTYTEADGVLKLYPPHGEGVIKSYLHTISFSAQSGDFSVTMDWSDFTSTDGALWVMILATVSSEIGMTYHSASNKPNQGYAEAAGVWQDVGRYAAGKLRLRRVGTTIYYDYDIGAGWVNLTTQTNSNDFSSFSICVTTVYESVAPHVFVDNFTVTL
jgi:hypothetical protein